MRKDNSPQLSQIMMTLANINDKLRETNELLSAISRNIAETPTTIKHLVVVKKCNKKPKTEP